MKKVLLALATCAMSVVAFSQPAQPSREDRDREHSALVQRAMEQRDRGGNEMNRHEAAPPAIMRPMAQPHRRHKVWVPAHREGRHQMRGHYDWR